MSDNLPSTDSEIQDAQRIALADNTMWRNLDGEAVLLQLDAGTYFGLNEVGTEALTLIEPGTTFGELRATLLQRFEVDEPTLRADLIELLTDMAARGLIELAPSPA